ncbi:MAG: GNAT family N-acetyltransferase [Dehalococcoidia bacterium]
MAEIVSVRPYRDSDASSLQWLHSRTPYSGRVAYKPIPPDETLERIADLYLAFWVAEHSDGLGEGIVGCVGLTDPETDPMMRLIADSPDFLRSSQRTVLLRMMRVAPELQRRGIGRGLFHVAERWAVEKGFARLALETAPRQEASIALYKAMGCDVAARTVQGRHELVWMAKDLSERDTVPR